MRIKSRLGRLALSLCLGAVPAGIGLGQTGGIVSAYACTTNTMYYYAPTQAHETGGADGVSATFSVNTLTPYVCDETRSHTLESAVLYLPLSSDYIEIGEDRGIISNSSGSQQCVCPNGLWYFNFTSTPSVGTSYLYASGFMVAGTAHTHQAQEITKCDPGCHLVAHYVTDATTWPEQPLPAGDNPGFYVGTQGEVYGDRTNSMGNATISNYQYHAGTWKPWDSPTVYAANAPYCNYLNSVNPFVTENLGPSSGGC